MNGHLITNKDLYYLMEQSNEKLNIILAGMTLVMEENDNMISLLENQMWFHRMAKTLFGKKRMSKEEMAEYQKEVNLYILQAIETLYDKHGFDDSLLLQLGNKLNLLCVSQMQIQSLLGTFARKLNEKTIGMDNYSAIMEELCRGIFDKDNVFLTINRILSRLDYGTVINERRMNILRKALEEKNILNNVKIRLLNIMEEFLSLNENEAGMLMLYFGNIRKEHVAGIMEKIMYAYYMLSAKERRIKSKRFLIQSILKQNNIDLECAMSTYELYNDFVNAYTNVMISFYNY